MLDNGLLLKMSSVTVFTFNKVSLRFTEGNLRKGSNSKSKQNGVMDLAICASCDCPLSLDNN